MLHAVADHILAMPPPLALAMVFAMPALESSAFMGFVFPGEIALVVGGVLASQGRLPLAAVLAAAVVGSVIGDSVGYAFGQRWGRRVLEGTLGRFVKRDHFDRAEAFLGRRGGPAVFFGRFTASLRVMVPGLAGMSAMHYRTFLFYNVSSAVCWGTMSVLIGYLAGNSYERVEHAASRAGLVAVAGVAVLALAWHLVRRRRRAVSEPLP